MKLSDRIILGLIITIFSYLVISHLVLKSKWTQGKFAEPGKDYALYEEHDLPEFKYLKLVGLSDCRLFSSVKARLDIERSMFRFVKFYSVGDTLIVDGSLTPDKRSSFSNGQTPQKVKIFLPDITRIEAVNSRLDVRGEKSSGSGRSFSFLLNESSLNTRAHFDMDTLPRFYDRFAVNASRHSEVYLFRKDHFNTVDIDLSQSNFYGRNAKGDHFNVRADSSSMVVSGGNDFQLILTR